MSRHTTTNQEAIAEPYRPVDPLPPSDPKIWQRQAGPKTIYGLGSKAMVWESTGCKDPASQKWWFRIVKLGSVATFAKDRAAAMRQAEFLLGVGEMEVREIQ